MFYELIFISLCILFYLLYALPLMENPEQFFQTFFPTITAFSAIHGSILHPQ